ncbi:siderophore ABC transporter substrate-binding protein [Suttonella ornithocola]|uniref:Uncharacterized ABC transporter solute-binding protein yclQ n=1 Tax=Suttonella ornithocola TaxID=279832 RepID=A0A380MNT9_9GAMM|nr:ABC transporter substrate-binding protein [Suttonella ornithocola]SUO94289.1 Uncharacterized ABC transporter solute-binding protein yclQ precursor [Suttonella ornithocola]
MRSLRRWILSGCMVLWLIATCAAASIDTARGNVTISEMPKRIAVYDWAALDSLHSLGVPIGATTRPVEIDYLAPVFAQAKTVGTLFEPDYEALAAYAPDLIITDGPGAVSYEQLAKLAPTIDMTIDNSAIRESGQKRIAAFAQLFGKQKSAEKIKATIDKAFANAQTAVKGHGNALVLSITGPKISAFGADSRLGSWLHKDIGMPAADTQLSNAPHGQPVTMEYVAKINPDWLIVLDRSAALGEPAAAWATLDNQLIHHTTAWRKQQIIIMPAANYIAAGGAQQLIDAAEQLTQAMKNKEE